MLVEVNSSDLRRVFQDIRPILRKGMDGALLGFTLEDHVLYITCSAGAVCEHQIASSHPGPYSLTVLYQDLSELLPGRGLIELDLTPVYVGIRGPNISAVLQQANGMVTRYRHRVDSFRPISPAFFQSMLQIFSETSAVSRALKAEASIVFCPPWAVMKFPTLWLQVPNRFINTSMSMRDLRSASSFEPVEFGTGGEVIELRRGAATLALPSSPVESCRFISDVTADHRPPETVAGANYLLRVQQLLRSAGPGACRLYLYKDGVEVSVQRPNVQSSVKVGKCTELIVSFPTFLEYLQMIFKLTGEGPFQVSCGRTSVCLSAQLFSLLMTII